MSTQAQIAQLEQYSLKVPRELFIVHAMHSGEIEEVIIFRGFSSSLSHPTAFDPDIPILPDQAQILRVDRLWGPYDPQNPQYIVQGLSWEAIAQWLADSG